MRSLFLIFCLVFCLLVVHAKEEKAPAAPAAEPVETEGSGDAEDAADAAEDKDVNEEGEEKEEEAEETPSKDDAEEDSDDDAEDSEEPEAETPKEFVCNLKYKRIGCYADKGAKDKPLSSFLMSDQDMGTTTKKGKMPKSDTFNGELPKFACKCANEALTTGNAIFGLQNIAECWSGPDDSKYDKDGPSDNCITFDYANCSPESEICAGKKGANFMYFVDTPDHTKTQEEIDKELAEDKKLLEKEEKEEKKKEKAAASKKGGKKGGKKKSKKSKAKH